MKNAQELRNRLINFFPGTPTADQLVLIEELAYYFTGDKKDVFVLRGFAGTGKTTTISALVETEKSMNRFPVLLAPTGRAAKVMSGYSNYPAFTIHKYIYRLRDEGDQGYGFELKNNKKKLTTFIVDEASMIHDDEGFGQSGLLGDLIRFVKQDASNKLILSGDIAQLPPVHTTLSPALVPAHLKARYGLSVSGAQLKEVVRQEKMSGILENATHIRKLIESETTQNAPELSLYNTDVFSITGNTQGEFIESAINQYGLEGFIIITRGNKSANIYNEQVRRRILYREDILDSGDLIMVVQNNYYWDAGKRGDFIANGEILKVQRTTEVEEKYGFKFMDVSIVFTDDETERQYDVKVLLDVLSEPAARQPFEERKKLFHTIFEEYYADIGKKREAVLKVKEDPFYNALQVKFAYGITCHKAQGGQWPVVFVDHSFFNEDMVNKEYFRWLYTAVTRATHKLYFVNLPAFFPGAVQDEF